MILVVVSQISPFSGVGFPMSEVRSMASSRTSIRSAEASLSGLSPSFRNELKSDKRIDCKARVEGRLATISLQSTK